MPSRKRGLESREAIYISDVAGFQLALEWWNENCLSNLSKNSSRLTAGYVEQLRSPLKMKPILVSNGTFDTTQLEGFNHKLTVG